MKTITKLFLTYSLFFVSKSFAATMDDRGNLSDTKTSIRFTENKGQVGDQNNQPRPDVLFSGTTGDLVYHLTKNGISYQFTRVDSWKEIPALSENCNGEKPKIPNQTTFFRIDQQWKGANLNPQIIKGEAYSDVNNYYSELCPNGVIGVKNYKEITYSNLYTGIDLKWYEKNGQLEYDYMVGAGVDYKKIQIEIKGASKLNINKEGELVITTPLGELIEHAPMVIQNNKILPSTWVLNTQNNTVSFSIQNIDASLPFTIDPAVRTWGTYYGGTGIEAVLGSSVNTSNELYVAGYSASSGGTTIATTGSHQTTYAGGASDAFLAKLNTSGVRIWSTYYGSSADDYGYSCTTFGATDIYLCGQSTSTTGVGIVTAGCHQGTYGGGSADAFLVKFNSSGVRSWGTFYGGTVSDYAQSCTTDATGNVIMTGQTSSATGISTAGSHQPVYGAGAPGTFDAYIVKFTSAGVRVFGTYYGGTSGDEAFSVSCDGSSNIFIAGTSSALGTVIATAGSHQPTPGSSLVPDHFLVKFNSTGVRQWGTYYGGAGDELTNVNCKALSTGEVYLAGTTATPTGLVIATTGSHQTAFGGTNDAYLAKFTAAGVRLFGTYYGGAGDERVGRTTAIDAAGNVYLCAQAQAAGIGVIGTTGSYQPTNGGGADGMLVKFNSSGVRQWGTYYGSASADIGYTCAVDALGNAYLAGNTASAGGTFIATSGSLQPVFGGGTNDGFVAQFIDCTPPTITGTTPGLRCGTGTVVLGATASAGTINWYAASTGGASLGTGTSFTTPSISTTTAYYVDATSGVGCTSSPRSLVLASINTIPTITSTTPGSRCGTGTVVLSATASHVSAAIDWYATPTGGVSLGTGATFTTPSISATTAYYAEASYVGCIGSPRTLVTATVNTAPTITGTTPNTRCGAGTVTLGATASAGTINWYAALTGGASLGAGVSFTTPSISATTTYYIDATNGGCTSTPRTAVIATVNPAPTVTGTAPGSRCGTGTVVIGATPSAGTIDWYTASVGGASIGTGTSFTTPSISINTTYYAQANNGGCLSTSRTAVLATINFMPTANGFPGQLCGPGVVALGASGTGVLNWYSAPTGGASLGTGPSFNTPSISTTTTYYVDATSGGCTSTPRIAVVATINPLPTVTGTGGSRCGTGTVVIGATASAGAINWFAAPTGGASLGTGTSFTTPSISSTTTYYAEANDAGCLTSPRVAVVATVNSFPPAPLNTTPGASLSICSGTTTVLTASGGGTIKWYTASTGGTLLFTGASFTTPVLSSTTTYYAEDNTACGASATRTAITVNVTATPSAPTNTTLVANLTICSGNSTTLSATAGGTLNWFNVPTGGSIIATGGTFTTPVLTTTTTYYVENNSTCGTSTRTAITVTVNPMPSIATTTVSNTITATQAGAIYQWLNCNTAFSAIPTETNQSYTASAAGDYAVFIDLNGCTDTSACQNISFLGVQDVNAVSNYEAFPNPTNTYLYLKNESLDRISIHLFDVTGKLVYETVSSEKLILLNIADVNSGMYFLKIENGTFSITQKIIKE